jgi:hypothetical protein
MVGRISMNALAFVTAILAGVASGYQASTIPSGGDAVRTVTSEEIRLADREQGLGRLNSGAAYRFVGRIRTIGISEDGLPKITFTGIEAVLNAGYDRRAVENLVPDTYIALECRPSPSREGLFIGLRQCSNPQAIQTVSADDYRAAYDRNPFQADSTFKDQEVVIHGTVRLRSRLNDGSDYVSFTTQGGFSDVVAIPSTDSRPLANEYARVGDVAVLYCRGGARWNLAGSIGLRECRFLQNY